MTHRAVLLTQCLQNDFVQPIGKYEAVPNKLHVGHAEARRLLGADPAEGPVARLMRWAQGTSAEDVGLIHVRDWHDPDDAEQRAHLATFGRHCVRESEGARFAFGHEATRAATIVDSTTLNDFAGTALAAALAPWSRGAVRVGVVGVWTEAKVTFLCYELATRYPGMEIAVCSALCASSSRQHHFAALDQLRRILGVRVVDSLGEFVAFLGGEPLAAPRHTASAGFPAVTVTRGAPLAATDLDLARYLFRDCREVELTPLSGGYSGNVVAAARSRDLHGHDQVPHVLKIGAREALGRERASFERVQEVLGNNAPAITDFADFGERGAIKYRYASMGGVEVTTFQKLYERGLPLAEVRSVLDTVFQEQLGRFSRAAVLESEDLLAHYGFAPKWAPSVRQKVEAILGAPADGDELVLAPGVATSNPCAFYEHTLAALPARPRDEFHQCWVHGDLNGANIVRDASGNVWLIDFFHTRRAHVLTDLVKLENDLLFLWTKIHDERGFGAACGMYDRLLQVVDLAAPLPQVNGLTEDLARTWETLRILRGYHPALVRSNRDPFQLLVGQLRYAAHTLSFDECTPWQKRFALYATGQLAARLTTALSRSTRLRLDWLDPALLAGGRLALTLLPGRKDRGRDLDVDLATVTEAGVTHVLCLVPSDELAHYGVGDLVAAYRARGLVVHHLPILDQKAVHRSAMGRAVAFLQDALRSGGVAMAHCVGGLGRTGMAAACLLRAGGLDAEAALAEVRRVRSPRAVETEEQEALVRAFGPRGEA